MGIIHTLSIISSSVTPSAVLVPIPLTEAALKLLSYKISAAVMLVVVDIVGEDSPMNFAIFLFIIIIDVALKYPPKWVVASTSTFMSEQENLMPHTLIPSTPN